MPWFISKQYRHSSMVCDCWKAPKDSVGHGLCKQGGEECQPMCKPKRTRDPLLKVWLTRGSECPLPFVDNNKHLSKHYFLYSLYAFKNLKSSSIWFNPCFPLRRAYLLLYVESVYLLLSILESNTCVNFVHHFLYACLLHLLYCFVLTNIPEIYMLKVESNCGNLNLPMCCFNALLWIYCFMS